MTMTWQERYDSARPSYTKVNDQKFADLEAGTTVLIPSPSDIEQAIADGDPNEVLTLTQLRDRLAARHDADGTCPVMCGMNLRVVAECAFEALDAGMPSRDLVPVWNVIDPTSKLAGKLPGGRPRIEELRSSSR